MILSDEYKLRASKESLEHCYQSLVSFGDTLSYEFSELGYEYKLTSVNGKVKLYVECELSTELSPLGLESLALKTKAKILALHKQKHKEF